MMWRYSGKTTLFTGKTLIMKDFQVKQRITGPQVGMVLGFKGLYLDTESKLTGNSYILFMGRATRAHAFDITPFSA